MDMTSSQAAVVAELLEAASERPLRINEARSARAYAAHLRGASPATAAESEIKSEITVDYVAIYAARRVATPMKTLERYNEQRTSGRG